MCAGEVQGPFLSFYFVIATVAGDVAVRHLLPGTSVHLAATEPIGGPKGLLDVLRLGASDDDPVHRLVPEQESQRILLQGDTGRNVVLLVYPLPPPRCSAFPPQELPRRPGHGVPDRRAVRHKKGLQDLGAVLVELLEGRVEERNDGGGEPLLIGGEAADGV